MSDRFTDELWQGISRHLRRHPGPPLRDRADRRQPARRRVRVLRRAGRPVPAALRRGAGRRGQPGAGQRADRDVRPARRGHHHRGAGPARQPAARAGPRPRRHRHRRAGARPPWPTPATCWRPSAAAPTPRAWARCCPATGSTGRWARSCCAAARPTRATRSGSTPTPATSSRAEVREVIDATDALAPGLSPGRAGPGAPALPGHQPLRVDVLGHGLPAGDLARLSG